MPEVWRRKVWEKMTREEKIEEIVEILENMASDPKVKAMKGILGSIRFMMRSHLERVAKEILDKIEEKK